MSHKIPMTGLKNTYSTKRRKSLTMGWKILFKYLSEYKKEIILLSILGVVSALANGLIPYIIGLFFDAILNPSIIFINTSTEMPLWLFLIIIFGTIQIIADIVDWINSKKRARIGTNIHAQYRARSASHLLKLPLAFHSNTKFGEAQEKIFIAGGHMGSMVDNVILNLAPQFLSIIVGFVVVFYINYTLATTLMIGVVIYVITLINVVSPLTELAKVGHRAWGEAWGVASDALSNIFTVKKFTSEEYERKRIYKKFINGAAQSWYKVQVVWSNISFYQRIIVTATRITIFVLSVYLIQEKIITIGELIALNGYAAMVFGPFVTLGMSWRTVQSGLAAIEDTEEMLSTPIENYYPRNAIKMDEINGEIELKNVSFYYNKKDGNVLKNVDLKVNAGEIIALVGESGVGKSTLIELLSGYYFAQKGEVLIDGVDVRRIDLEFLRKNIAVVPQEVALFNDTIKMNIKYGSFSATDKEIKNAAREAHADVFIEKFSKKYKQVVGERGVKLSVGQKQRIAIARAILRDPKILILDEPTSALDAETEHYITTSLERLMHGRTTFIIAHRLSTVRKADKIFVFKKGRVVELGSHEELIKIKNGVYRRLYNLQIGFV